MLSRNVLSTVVIAALRFASMSASRLLLLQGLPLGRLPLCGVSGVEKEESRDDFLDVRNKFPAKCGDKSKVSWY